MGDRLQIELLKALADAKQILKINMDLTMSIFLEVETETQSEAMCRRSPLKVQKFKFRDEFVA